MKPTIEHFTLSLLYPKQRIAIGLHLTDDQASALLRTPAAAAQYYEEWTPSHVPAKRSFLQDAIESKPKKRRHIMGTAVLLPLAILFAAVIALSSYGVIQAFQHPGQSILTVPSVSPEP